MTASGSVYRKLNAAKRPPAKQLPAHDHVELRFAASEKTPGADSVQETPKLPKFSQEGFMAFDLLAHTAHIRPVEENWPIRLMMALCATGSVQNYLNEQSIRPYDIYEGLNDKFLPGIQKAYRQVVDANGGRDTVGPLEDRMSDEKYQKLKAQVREFALREGYQQTTPVAIWRWLMKEDPTRNIEDTLEKSGISKEVIKSLRQAKMDKSRKVNDDQPRRPTKEDILRMEALYAQLPEEVLGQEEPLNEMMDVIENRRLGYATEEDDPNAPDVFLLIGPPGVGKTRAVTKISKLDGKKCIYLAMNEYKDAQTISKVGGAAPGYIGHGTSKSIADRVLEANEETSNKGIPEPDMALDEIEKAHEDIWDVLMQVFDKGVLENGKGQTASFRGMRLFMTSNIAQREIIDLYREGKKAGKSLDQIREETRAMVMDNLEKRFRPDILRRIHHVVIFNPLTRENAGKILDKHIQALQQAAKKVDDYELVVEPAVRDTILDRGYNDENLALGATGVIRELRQALRVPLTKKRKELIMADQLPNKGKMVAKLQNGTVSLEFIPEPGSAPPISQKPPAGTPD
jgi:ATP-dependent Clp protease ATP-binding subunit ClpA